MIQVERKTPKQPKELTLEEQVAIQQETITQQAQDIEVLRQVIDDLILNGGVI